MGFVGDAGKKGRMLVGILGKQTVCDKKRKGYGASEETRGGINPSSSRVMEIFMPLGVWAV